MESNDPDIACYEYGLFGANYGRPGRRVLTDLTLPVRKGELHVLAGANHSGKSLVCSILYGETSPDSGTVLLRGAPHRAVTMRLARKAGVTMVADIPKVVTNLTVVENFLSGEQSWRRAFRSWRAFSSDLEKWLVSLGIDLPLSAKLDALPVEDWVFVEILARLYRRPGLLILDGALEAISARRRRVLMPILRQAIAGGMSALWVTHKLEEAMPEADMLTVVKNGRSLLTSPPVGLDRLNVIQLCYAQMDGHDEIDATRQRFLQLMRYTEALVKDLPQAVAVMDTDKRVRFVNKSAGSMFAGAEESRLGSGLGDLLGEANRDIAAMVAREAENGGDAEWHNIPVRRAGGEMLADVTLRRIDENNVCVGYILQIEDVSARENMRRRLTLSDNLASVGLLAAGVAHEVNNPLEIMGNYLAFLKRRIDDGEDRRVLARLEEESARIQQIVNNLIVYSGNAPATNALVDLPELARELAELLRFHNRERRIVIECRSETPDILVRADPNEIRQVFLNLFRNAIAAMRDGGKIDIDFSVEDGEGGRLAVMRFADNGPGIKLDKLDDVFMPFVTTNKSDGKNHGLGLFIVHGLVEKYGGAIRVENLPEAGCRFTLAFPLASAE